VDSERVLASVCEAVIGAVYLEYGYDRTAPAVVEAFAAQVDEALESPDDFKSLLQEKLARRGDVVEYVIAAEEGPPHDRRFESVAQVEGEEIGRGAGKSKKSAEQSAALAALTAMDND
jgi:ribonuclease-3